MKALVLSGGTATRLRPFSNAIPKQLIPIAGKPVLEHVLHGIAEAGLTDVAIIVGDSATAIKTAIGDGTRLGLHVDYIRQDRPLGLAHCVKLARSYLADDDFVMHLGDNMLPDGIADHLRRFRERRPAVQLLVRKVSDPQEFGVAELADNGLVRRLEEKPACPRSDLAVLGVYFFTAAIHEAVEAIRPGRRGELEITDAIQWLISNGTPVQDSEYAGYWRDIGRAEDVLACNRRLMDEFLPVVHGTVDAASELIGGVVVQPGARVAGSRITGPAFIGKDSLIENCVLGPYAAIGRGCVLRGARVTDSIVIDHTELTNGATVHSSLVSPDPAHSIHAADTTRRGLASSDSASRRKAPAQPPAESRLLMPR